MRRRSISFGSGGGRVRLPASSYAPPASAPLGDEGDRGEGVAGVFTGAGRAELIEDMREPGGAFS